MQISKQIYDNIDRLRVLRRIESMNALAIRCGWEGAAVFNRIKSGDNVGIKTFLRIAGSLKVELWQLFMPGFDPDNPPEQVTTGERELLALFRKQPFPKS